MHLPDVQKGICFWKCNMIALRKYIMLLTTIQEEKKVWTIYFIHPMLIAKSFPPINHFGPGKASESLARIDQYCAGGGGVEKGRFFSLNIFKWNNTDTCFRDLQLILYGLTAHNWQK